MFDLETLVNVADASWKGAAALTLSSAVVENIIHRFGLHAINPKSEAVESWRVAHDKNHHVGYCPKTYYQIPANLHAVLRFTEQYIPVIAKIGAAVGAVVGYLVSMPGLESTIEGIVGGAVGGTAAVLGYYGVYEFTHKYMHVIGERRIRIGNVVAAYVADKTVQELNESKESQSLKLDKYALDQMLDYVDDTISGKKVKLKPKIKKHIENVFAEQDVNINLNEVLAYTVKDVKEWEVKHLESITPEERKEYHSVRKTYRNLRRIWPFQRWERHHLVHHFGAPRENANVIAKWCDRLMGTLQKSSKKFLMETKKYRMRVNSYSNVVYDLPGDPQ